MFPLMKLPYAIYAPHISFAESQKDLQLFVRITFVHHFISLSPFVTVAIKSSCLIIISKITALKEMARKTW